jgi:hypothetical protein
MTIGAIGTAPATWGEPTRAEESGLKAGLRDRAGVAGPAAADGIPERAMEIVLAGEAQNADAAQRDARAAVRQAVRRRIEARECIRELRHKILEAQQEGSLWQKIGSAFKWIGTALAVVASVAASVVSFGSAAAGAIAGTVFLVAAVSGAAAGAGSALSGLGVGYYQREAMKSEADRMAADGRIQEARDGMAQAEAFAQAIVQTEEAMRRQALAWVEKEDEARVRAASAAAQ